jgi:diguanylate cyclase (GGDEF)-like protein
MPARHARVTHAAIMRYRPGPATIAVASLLCLLIGLLYVALQIRTVFSDQLRQEYAGLVVESLEHAQSARNEAGVWQQAGSPNSQTTLNGYRQARAELTHRLELFAALVNASPAAPRHAASTVPRPDTNLVETDALLAHEFSYWRAQRDGASAEMHARITQAAHTVIALAALLFCMLLTALGMYAKRNRQLVGQSQEFEHAALHDPLTGLANRSKFFSALEQAAARPHDAFVPRSMAVLYVDLDGFKQVNDTLGHRVGDEFLISVSRRFRESLRKVDVVARIGGDEFAVLIPAFSSHAELEEIAQRLIACVVRTDEQIGIGTVRASIGIATFPDLVDDHRRLVAAADHAMYEVKRGGKNGYAFVAAQEQPAA